MKKKKRKVRTYWMNLFDRRSVICQGKKALSLERIQYYIKQLEHYASTHRNKFKIKVLIYEASLMGYTKKEISSLFNEENIVVEWR